MAEVVTEADVAASEEKAVFQENRLLAAIRVKPSGSLAEWAQDCGWFLQGKAGDQNQPNKSLARRVIARLQKDKLVAKEGRSFTLTKTGRTTAQKAADASSPQS
jgi:hypothetical protein